MCLLAESRRLVQGGSTTHTQSPPELPGKAQAEPTPGAPVIAQ